MKKMLVTLFSLILSVAVQANDGEKSEVEKRIKPVGEVYLAGAVTEQVAAAPSGPKSGADVYQASCFACHGTGAMGAPKKGDAAAWAPRTAKGMDVLLEHAIKGFNAMPPKGTCMACSDDEIQAAIDFMLK
jgi:cytochrome c5|tara:strand:+ start:233 stop:625 length:393 start_codon:yes stop_codon:yes gene_type:complete